VFSAEFLNPDTCFCLIQNSDDLFFCKPFLYGSSPSFFLIKILLEPLNQTGPKFGGKVTLALEYGKVMENITQ
jgi:hypothetical protein